MAAWAALRRGSSDFYRFYVTFHSEYPEIEAFHWISSMISARLTHANGVPSLASFEAGWRQLRDRRPDGRVAGAAMARGPVLVRWGSREAGAGEGCLGA